METVTAPMTKPYKGMAMEGMVATRYARNTGKSLTEFRDLAKRIGAQLRPGDRVLEVAPGPGYLAIELAQLAPYVRTKIAEAGVSGSGDCRGDRSRSSAAGAYRRGFGRTNRTSSPLDRASTSRRNLLAGALRLRSSEVQARYNFTIIEMPGCPCHSFAA